MPEPAKIVFKTDVHFGHFFRKLYQKEMFEMGIRKPNIRCVFTVGEDNHHWRTAYATGTGTGTHTAGMTVEADRTPNMAEYYGTMLIDLNVFFRNKTRLSTANRDSGIERPAQKVNFNQPRYEVLATMAHEYYHMIQVWRVGDDQHKREYASTHAELRREKREQLKKAGRNIDETAVWAHAHGNHPHELAAESISRDRLAPYRKDIDKGLWDGALPIDLMRSLHAMAN